MLKENTKEGVMEGQRRQKSGDNGLLREIKGEKRALKTLSAIYYKTMTPETDEDLVLSKSHAIFVVFLKLYDDILADFNI